MASWDSNCCLVLIRIDMCATVFNKKLYYHKIMQLEEDFGTEIVICKCKICGNCIFNSERGDEDCLACKKGFHKNKKLF